jgi:ABC-2 type transport system permease protein
MSSYSQFTAFRALTVAALRSISKSPSSVIFTLAFPLIFILVFGFLGKNAPATIMVAMAPQVDSQNAIVQALKQSSFIKIVEEQNPEVLEAQLNKGDIAAIIDINARQQGYQVQLQTNASQSDKIEQLKSAIELHVLKNDTQVQTRQSALLQINESVVSSRRFESIDFILPGQLGFSLLAASVFGTAFVFFSLRQTLVLKRFFATPVYRSSILIAEGLARMVFQIVGAAVIILIGKWVFGYTLVHGAITFFNMMLLCVIALMVFMSFGFVISGLAKSESTIPPLANIVTLPQFLLAGTFFSVEAFPAWLKPISYALPLTYFNDAIRAIAFDGASLWDVKAEIGVLLLWGIGGYALATKTFKWE